MLNILSVSHEQREAIVDLIYQPSPEGEPCPHTRDELRALVDVAAHAADLAISRAWDSAQLTVSAAVCMSLFAKFMESTGPKIRELMMNLSEAKLADPACDCPACLIRRAIEETGILDASNGETVQ